MRASILAASVLLLPFCAFPASGAPAQVVLTCQGQKVTVVAVDNVGRGTNGDDVIVLLDATRVYALEGDDLVCVRSPDAFVSVGKGDDHVVVESRREREVEVWLGPGSDTFIGGPGPDVVASGSGLSHTDTIFTRGGRDFVVTGGARDTVGLGDGVDRLILGHPTARRADFRGGRGRDSFYFSFGFGKGRVEVDNAAGWARHDSRVFARWDGFEDFDLEFFSSDTLRFVGGPADEQVRFSTTAPVASMGGGDDEVDIFGTPTTGLDGGPGTDTLDSVVHSGSHVAGSLVSDTITWDDDGPQAISFTAFENLEVSNPGYPVALVGDDGDNVLMTSGCGGSAHGGSGNDLLGVLDFVGPLNGECRPYAWLYGEAGDDRLIGASGNDVLDGGDGTDSADGGRGTDTCAAETRVRCEA